MSFEKLHSSAKLKKETKGLRLLHVFVFTQEII